MNQQTLPAVIKQPNFALDAVGTTDANPSLPAYQPNPEMHAQPLQHMPYVETTAAGNAYPSAYAGDNTQYWQPQSEAFPQADPYSAVRLEVRQANYVTGTRDSWASATHSNICRTQINFVPPASATKRQKPFYQRPVVWICLMQAGVIAWMVWGVTGKNAHRQAEFTRSATMLLSVPSGLWNGTIPIPFFGQTADTDSANDHVGPNKSKKKQRPHGKHGAQAISRAGMMIPPPPPNVTIPASSLLQVPPPPVAISLSGPGAVAAATIANTFSPRQSEPVVKNEPPRGTKQEPKPETKPDSPKDFGSVLPGLEGESSMANVEPVPEQIEGYGKTLGPEAFGAVYEAPQVPVHQPPQRSMMVGNRKRIVTDR